MKFIDENSFNRLNFKNILSKIEVLSPYGKEKLNSIDIFKIGEEEKLISEFNKMEKIYNFISENKKSIAEIEAILHRFKNIKNIFKLLLEDVVLDTVDLFEIKVQLLAINRLDNELRKYPEIFSEFFLSDVSKVIEALDPNDEKIATFHIYEKYSVILKEIRRLKKEVENRLFIEKDFEKQKQYKNERLSILVDEEKEEFKIRRNLSKFIKLSSKIILENINKISELDLIIGKIKFASTYGGVKPIVSFEKEIILKEAVNIEVKEILELVNKKYTPIDISLNIGTTIITGANMGGKSVALKTIAENVLLFHMGIYPFAKFAKIPLLDFLFFISDDMQDLSKGLSTFGAEIIKLEEVNKSLKLGTGLIVFDEFARGTNPKEGQKFVKALAKYLNSKNSFSLITTHFDSIVSNNMKHYQVVGLKNLDFDKLKTKMLVNNNSMELIQEHMDFSLEETLNDEVPKDAFNIAKLIGLDEEISKMIYDEYTEEDCNEQQIRS